MVKRKHFNNENQLGLDLFFCESDPVIETVIEQLNDVEGVNVERVAGGTYRLTACSTGPLKSALSKVKANIEAIRILKELGDEPATFEEQQKLVMFSGFGASEIRNKLFSNPQKEWRQLEDEINQLLSEDEIRKLHQSSQYVHYTPPAIISAMYEAIGNFGLKKGLVFEGGSGLGNFIGCLPETFNPAQYTGAEFESISAAICNKLYPETPIVVADFLKMGLPKDHFCVALGNVPFSNVNVFKKGYEGFLLHDYFIARQIDSLREGGIGAFITSKGTMDKVSSDVRDYIASKASFLGAVRLPNTAFDSAGTAVVADVLFFLKGQSPKAKSFRNSHVYKVIGEDENKTSLSMNEYFMANPEMILGDLEVVSGPFGPELTVTPNGDLESQLDEAIDRLSSPVTLELDNETLYDNSKRYELNPTSDEEHYYIDDENSIRFVAEGCGELVKVRGGTQRSGFSKRQAEIIRDYLPLRDAVINVFDLQLKDEDSTAAQKEMNELYDIFVSKYGCINQEKITVRGTGDNKVEIFQEPIISTLSHDKDIYRVASIEIFDDETNTAKKGPIFTQRIIGNRAINPIAKSALDALNISLNQVNKVDLDLMVSVYQGSTQESIIEELGTLLFLDPATNEYTTREEYLAGEIQQKIDAAKGAELHVNVKELEAVLPEDLPLTRVPIRLGAHWIPSSIVKTFATEVLKAGDVSVRSLNTKNASTWIVGGNFSITEYDTEKRTTQQILTYALNNTTIKVTQVIDSPDGKVTIVDHEETAAVQFKVSEMKEAFYNFVLADTERSNEVHTIYNELYNTFVPREYSGQHLVIPGLAATFEPHFWQLNFVYRAITQGWLYAAHSMGSGKTVSSIMACAERKRLGLSKKPVIVVLKATLKSFAASYYNCYPNANLLVADDEKLNKKNRRRFIANLTSNEYDCVIMTHEAFTRLPLSDQYIEDYVMDEIHDLEAMQYEAKENGDHGSFLYYQRQIENRQRKLESLTSQKRKDQGITFEETGIDYVIVDEAHKAKKIGFTTSINNMKGLDPSASSIGVDVLLKSMYLREVGGAMALMSGTPITNSIAEAYGIERVIQPEIMVEQGVYQFDSWAALHADTRTSIEMTPAGNFQSVTRFAEFQALPALHRRKDRFMDIVTDKIMDATATVKRPKKVGGTRQIGIVPRSPELKALQKDFERRINECKGKRPEKGADNILCIINDGRRSSLDCRLVGVEQHTESKLDHIIKDVADMYHKTADREYTHNGEVSSIKGGTIAVFSDVQAFHKTNLLTGKKEVEFSAWEYATDQLVNKYGVKRSDIANVNAFNTDKKKKRLFRDLNSGKKRIVFGGSETLGTGANFQNRLVFLAHADLPYTPHLILQREARGYRVGNQNEELLIKAYSTEQTLDSFMWSLNETKTAFIDAFMNSDMDVDCVGDVGDDIDQMALAKAMSSGNPALLEMTAVESEVKKLSMSKSAFLNNRQLNCNRLMLINEHSLPNTEYRIEKLSEAVKLTSGVNLQGENFKMKIEDQAVNKQKLAGEMLLDSIINHGFNGKTHGSIAGLSVTQTGNDLCLDLGFHTVAVIRSRAFIDNDTCPVGLISSIRSAVLNLGANLDKEIKFLEDLKAERESLAAVMNSEWPYEEQYQSKVGRLNTLKEQIANEKSFAANDEDQDEAEAA